MNLRRGLMAQMAGTRIFEQTLNITSETACTNAKQVAEMLMSVLGENTVLLSMELNGEPTVNNQFVDYVYYTQSSGDSAVQYIFAAIYHRWRNNTLNTFTWGQSNYDCVTVAGTSYLLKYIKL